MDPMQSEPGGIVAFKPTDQQTHQLRPVLLGRLSLGMPPEKRRFEVGYLFGLTPRDREG